MTIPKHLSIGSGPTLPGTVPATPDSVQPEPKPPIAPGQIIGGRYLVGTLIGEGGMGLVCAATHLGLDSPVAIKLIRPDLKHDAEFVERFLNEARRAAALSGEHIASVHDVGRLDSGEPYLVMERLEGTELEAYLRHTGPLDPVQAVDIVLQACEGLAEAHAAGIVHRDLKPANLFLARRGDGKEVVKILDFGISKTVTDEAPSSITNRSLGSPWYMSPEQMLDTSSVDFRADIWSLGVVLFELLTNQLPFDGQSVPEVCVKVLTGSAPAPSSRIPGLDPELDAIVLRCLQREREQRYPSVHELALDLSAFLARYSGERHASRHRSDRYGSLTPISGAFVLAPNRRRSRSRKLGWIGLAATVMLAALAVGATLRGSARVSARDFHLPLPVALQAGPDSLPLDKGNEPVTAAVRGPLIGSTLPAVTPVAPPAVAALTDSPSRVDAVPTAPAFSRPAHQPQTPPTLTPIEIERRKLRYEAWLRSQGLQRVNEPDPAR